MDETKKTENEEEINTTDVVNSPTEASSDVAAVKDVTEEILVPEAVVDEIVAAAEAVIPEVVATASPDTVIPPARDFRPTGRGQGGRRGQGGAGGKRGGRPKTPREKPEFDSKMISIRRVTRVVAGGRRFALSVAVVAGDRNGKVGLGTGKATDTQAAIEKALKQAKKNMMTLKLTKQRSMPHDVSAKFSSAKVMIMPNKGKGIIAGSSARVILNLAGVKDVTAKFNSGTKNKLNNARATMKALEEIAYAWGDAPVAATKIVKEETSKE